MPYIIVGTGPCNKCSNVLWCIERCKAKKQWLKEQREKKLAHQQKPDVEEQ